MNRSSSKRFVQRVIAHLTSDVTAGFVVFLIALPLSLSIAKASNVPPIVGVITSVIGGLVVTFFSGSRLTIKGPAAGLIVVVAGAVSAFGGGAGGWRLAAAAMLAAGLVQIAFGLLRLGRLVDFFPPAAIHGMLSGIGLIIIIKQLPILLNVPPPAVSDLSVAELLLSAPTWILSGDLIVCLLGVLCLICMISWPRLRYRWFAGIPASLIVLLIAIPGAHVLAFEKVLPEHTLLQVGSLLEALDWQVDWTAVYQPYLFVKYVMMFALIGSIESLLTVRAADLMSPVRRWSKPDKDLIAVGIGNTIASVFGAIPMISEVARSSANIRSGARTRWANFYHGLWLLVFVLLFYPLLEMIPNTALAAMLIAVGLHLIDVASIKTIISGDRWQLAIILLVVLFTVFFDLLLGVAVGICLALLLPILRGVSYRRLFKLQYDHIDTGQGSRFILEGSALFSNYLSLKSDLDRLPDGGVIEIVYGEDMYLVDSTFRQSLDEFSADYRQSGGEVILDGLQEMTRLYDGAYTCAIRRKNRSAKRQR